MGLKKVGKDIQTFGLSYQVNVGEQVMLGIKLLPSSTTTNLDRITFATGDLLYWLRHTAAQCSRLKSSMPFKRDLALQNIPLSK